jgi:hypothetical protein
MRSDTNFLILELDRANKRVRLTIDDSHPFLLVKLGRAERLGNWGRRQASYMEKSAKFEVGPGTFLHHTKHDLFDLSFGDIQAVEQWTSSFQGTLHNELKTSAGKKSLGNIASLWSLLVDHGALGRVALQNLGRLLADTIGPGRVQTKLIPTVDEGPAPWMTAMSQATSSFTAAMGAPPELDFAGRQREEIARDLQERSRNLEPLEQGLPDLRGVFDSILEEGAARVLFAAAPAQ